MKINTYLELLEAVENEDGVKSIQMKELRDIEGQDKLGRLIVQRIQDELDDVGLGYYPSELPGNQNAFALVYIKKSAAGRILDALNPVTETSDKTIRDVANNIATNQIARIRKILNEA